ncbi:hypothetical protein B0T12DRAFT_344246, partial [Alternaria alternata]
FVQNDTYDHRTLKIRLPVRSAIYKQCTGGLVVRWVTTSESPLLYVFCFLSHISFKQGGLPVACASLEQKNECTIGVHRATEIQHVRPWPTLYCC